MDNSNEKASEARWEKDYTLEEKCPARGSDLCWKFASSEKGCEACYVRGLRENYAKDEACAQWEQTVRLLPPDIDTLSSSKTCLFCAGDEKEPADGYAVIDMANPEPAHYKGIIFGYGKKVRTPVGSLVSLHVAVGKKCRKAFRTVEVIQIGWVIGMVVLAFVMLSIPAIAQPMVNAFVLLPVIFLALMAGAGYALGRYQAMAYMRRKSSEVNFDVGTIPEVAAMLNRDWYFFQTDHGMPRMSWSKKLGFPGLLPPKEKQDMIDTAE